VAGSPKPERSWRTRAEKAKSTARAAPDWMVMLNRSDCWGSQWEFSARSRWPVDEMGRNSVTPSMMPRMQTASQAGTNR
jgi:hypothetical protein